MKSIRRSLQSRERASTGSGGGRPSSGAAIGSVLPQLKRTGAVPPKQVIKAIYTYKSQSAQELSFQAGDFFHVVGSATSNGDEWYDAANPATGARGLVPATYFQILGRNERETADMQNRPTSPTLSSSPAYAALPNKASSPSSPMLSPASASGFAAQQSAKPKSQPLYGVVQYDFKAERADELEARKGEPIIVIAQSNHEWFVAKPIGRLGGPGLIPVSFVAISDTATGQPLSADRVRDMIQSGMVPPVEEWKKTTAEYKQNSIPLGRFEFNNTSPPVTGVPRAASPATSASSMPVQSAKLRNSGTSSNGIGMAAYPPQHMSYSSPNLGAPSTGYTPPSSIPPKAPAPPPPAPVEPQDLSPEEARERYGLVLTASVESFHVEEGAYWFHLQCTFVNGYTLILYRLYDDFYDFQIALMAEFPVEAGRDAPPGEQPKRIIPPMPGPVDKVDDIVCAQRVQDLTQYLEQLCYLPEYMRDHALFYDFFAIRPGDVEARVPEPVEQSLTGYDESLELNKDLVEMLDGMSIQQQSLNSSKASSTKPPGISTHLPKSSISGPMSAGSSFTSGFRPPSSPSNTAWAPTASQHSSFSSDLPHRITSANLSSPPANRNPAPNVGFVKIKIFHRNTDDLIAIRVPPTVTYMSLLEKVRDRLGGDIGRLKYREDASQKMVELHGSDHELAQWIGEASKLVLFAEPA